jgi:hypothetical protein
LEDIMPFQFTKMGVPPVIVEDHQIEMALLRINGGGWRADQTANAMVDLELLRQGKEVKRGPWTVKRTGTD